MSKKIISLQSRTQRRSKTSAWTKTKCRHLVKWVYVTCQSVTVQQHPCQRRCEGLSISVQIGRRRCALLKHAAWTWSCSALTGCRPA